MLTRGRGALMAAVIECETMGSALRRVEASQGSAGVDQMPVDQPGPYLREHRPRILRKNC